MLTNTQRFMELIDRPYSLYESWEDTTPFPDARVVREQSWVAACWHPQVLRDGFLDRAGVTKSDYVLRVSVDSALPVELETQLFGTAAAGALWEACDGAAKRPVSHNNQRPYTRRSSLQQAFRVGSRGMTLPIVREAMSGALLTMCKTAQGDRDVYDVPLFVLPGAHGSDDGFVAVLGKAISSQKLALSALEHLCANGKVNEIKDFWVQVVRFGLLDARFDVALSFRLLLMRYLPYMLSNVSRLTRVPGIKPALYPGRLAIPGDPDHQDMPRIRAALAHVESLCARFSFGFDNYPLVSRCLLVSREMFGKQDVIKASSSTNSKPRKPANVGLLKNFTPEEKRAWWVERAAQMREARLAKRREKLLGISKT